MTPNWVFQALWFGVGIGGMGVVWYFLSQGYYLTVLWTGFVTAVVVCFMITLHIRKNLSQRAEQGSPMKSPNAERPQPDRRVHEPQATPDSRRQPPRGTGSPEAPPLSKRVPMGADAEPDYVVVRTFFATDRNITGYTKPTKCSEVLARILHMEHLT